MPRTVRFGSVQLPDVKWLEIREPLEAEIERDLLDYSIDYSSMNFNQKMQALIAAQFKEQVKRVRRNIQDQEIQTTKRNNKVENDDYVSDFIEDTTE